MRIVTCRTMAEIDRRSQEEYHIPGMLLMENAGIRAFQRLREIWEQKLGISPIQDIRCLIAAGGGNNGGDALVMARQALIAGLEDLHVVMRNRRTNELASTHLAIIESLGIPVVFWEENPDQSKELIQTADMIIDGIAGTGMKEALRGSAAELTEWINNAAVGYICAVDIPSGLGPEYLPGYPAVQADLTLTMGLPKLSLYTPAGRRLCGEIELIDPGFPPQLLEDPEGCGRLISEGDDHSWLLYSTAAADEAAYKNTRGHVGVFAGSIGTTGAALLAAETAGRVGTGLVTLYGDEEIYPILASGCRSVMVRPLIGRPDAEPSDFSIKDTHTALLAGPGWGTEGREELLTVLLESGLPGVIDADGIRVLKLLRQKKGDAYIRDLTGGRWVLTPHPGEFLYLASGSSAECSKEELLARPLEPMLSLASDLQVLVVLKTHVVWICAPDGRYTVVDGMNPAMGTGGAGDVLAGATAGLVSRGGDLFDAVAAAAALHQQAGRAAEERNGWFLAEDLPRYLSVLLGGKHDVEEG
ncbi:MAG: NAD(P)H-hydrate dehydratase [Spirochaetota bacterium]|nr:NAD(P)H-hydrate dehydratase [Spirochaetota bacterium]